MGVADAEGITFDGGVKTTNLRSVFSGGFEAKGGVAEASGAFEMGEQIRLGQHQLALHVELQEWASWPQEEWRERLQAYA